MIGFLRSLPRYLSDAGLLLLAIVALPVAILVIGAPIAWVIRLGVSLFQH